MAKLSNQTKLERINNKMEVLGMFVHLGSNNGREYTPSLYSKGNRHPNYVKYLETGVYIGVYMDDKRNLRLYVEEIKGVDLHRHKRGWNYGEYVEWVCRVAKVIEYANGLDLEIPLYCNN